VSSGQRSPHRCSAGPLAPDPSHPENIFPAFVSLILCQTVAMARGWESKDVESQVENNKAPQQKAAAGPKTPEQIQRDQQR